MKSTPAEVSPWWLWFQTTHNTGGVEEDNSHRSVVLSESTKSSTWEETLTSCHSVNDRKEKGQGRHTVQEFSRNESG